MTRSDSKKAGPDSGITDATTPISKLKSPKPPRFVTGAWNKFSQAHLMTGGDESVLCATHFSNYVRAAAAMPLKEYLHEGGPWCVRWARAFAPQSSRSDSRERRLCPCDDSVFWLLAGDRLRIQTIVRGS